MKQIQVAALTAKWTSRDEFELLLNNTLVESGQCGLNSAKILKVVDSGFNEHIKMVVIGFDYGSHVEELENGCELIDYVMESQEIASVIHSHAY